MKHPDFITVRCWKYSEWCSLVVQLVKDGGQAKIEVLVKLLKQICWDLFFWLPSSEILRIKWHIVKARSATQDY